jgi:hypothetical protein
MNGTEVNSSTLDLSRNRRCEVILHIDGNGVTRDLAEFNAGYEVPLQIVFIKVRVDSIGGAIVKMFAVLFLLLSQSGVAPNETALEGAWLEADSKWINGPKGVAPPGEQWSQTAVLYFGKDHKFALIYCTVILVPKKYKNISNGDPRGVYRGEWSVEDDTVSLTYKLVEQTVLLQGKKLPGPIQHAKVKISSGLTLGFDGKQFRREVALDESASH